MIDATKHEAWRRKAERRRDIRLRLFNRDPRCNYCRSTISRFGKSTLDHVVPKSAGGTDAPANLVLCCRLCNSFKGARRIPELMAWVIRVAMVAVVRRIPFARLAKGGAA